MARKGEVEVDLDDKSAYVGVDEMYQNSADITGHALAGDEEQAPESQAAYAAEVAVTVNPDGEPVGPSVVPAVTPEVEAVATVEAEVTTDTPLPVGDNAPADDGNADVTEAADDAVSTDDGSQD